MTSSSKPAAAQRWLLLNLNAEAEWSGGRLSAEHSARWARQVPPFWGPKDQLEYSATQAPTATHSPAGSLAWSWAATPSALAWMRGAGLEPAVRADPASAARVNHRQFALPFQTGLDRAGFATSAAEVEALLRRARSGESWWAKQAWSCAGRGRRVFDPNGLQAADEKFLKRALGSGGVQLEPKVEPLEEWALHAWLQGDGRHRFGPWTRQRVDGHGQWQGSEVATGGPGSDREESEALAERLVDAARREGYTGPLGIDGFRYRDAAGGLGWRFGGDLNGRFSMGWSASGLGLPPG